MKLLLSAFLILIASTNLFSQNKVWEKTFTSSSRYHTLGDLSITKDKTKLLLAITDAIGRIEVDVLDTSGNVLKQMWHGRTDCTSWEYRAHSILEFNDNYVVGCSSDASCFPLSGAFLLVLDTNLNVLKEIELPQSYRGLEKVNIYSSNNNLYVNYLTNFNPQVQQFCKFDTNYVRRTWFSSRMDSTQFGIGFSFCSPNLFGFSSHGYDISNKKVLFSGIQINYQTHKIDTFKNSYVIDSLIFESHMAYSASVPIVIENSCKNEFLILNKDSILIKNGDDLVTTKSNNSWINNTSNVVSIYATNKLTEGGYASLLAVERNGHWYPELVRFDYLLNQFTFTSLGNSQWSPIVNYGNHMADAGDYIYTGVNQVLTDSNIKKESFIISKIKISNLNTGITKLPSKKEITVFPNPTTSTVTIRFSKSSETWVSLFSVSGILLVHKHVFNTNSANFDLSGFPKGVYLIQVKTRQGSQTVKVVRE